MATFNYQQPGIGNPETRAAFAALVAEVAKLRTAYAAMLVKLDTGFGKLNSVLAKLDADGGVTDTDYAALHVAAVNYVSTVSAAANEFVP